MSASGPGRVKTQSMLWFPLLNRGGMMKGFVQGAERVLLCAPCDRSGRSAQPEVAPGLTPDSIQPK
jgi:putative component of membrane protein insertase Oxa1/YidC/SpoIIIJ protein YidD